MAVAGAVRMVLFHVSLFIRYRCSFVTVIVRRIKQFTCRDLSSVHVQLVEGGG